MRLALIVAASGLVGFWVWHKRSKQPKQQEMSLEWRQRALPKYGGDWSANR